MKSISDYFMKLNLYILILTLIYDVPMICCRANHNIEEIESPNNGPFRMASCTLYT
jgi:hypothetical protein